MALHKEAKKSQRLPRATASPRTAHDTNPFGSPRSATFGARLEGIAVWITEGKSSRRVHCTTNRQINKPKPEPPRRPGQWSQGRGSQLTPRRLRIKKRIRSLLVPFPLKSPPTTRTQGSTSPNCPRSVLKLQRPAPLSKEKEEYTLLTTVPSPTGCVREATIAACSPHRRR